jgi:hypothetical protein
MAVAVRGTTNRAVIRIADIDASLRKSPIK